MHPDKVSRERLRKLTDLPNIGKAGSEDLRLLGITHPSQLAGQCAFDMYERLCGITASRHDPCVIDVFLSITHFMNGEAAKPWWAYTEQRKAAIRVNSKR